MTGRRFVTAAVSAAALQVPALAQLGERPGGSTDNPIDVPRDLSGLSIKDPRVRAVHTTDPALAGGSMYLQKVDPWLGYQARETRSMMLQLEMPPHAIRERIARARHELRGRTHWLIMPEGFAGLERGEALDQLSRAIERRKIGFLVMDPLHQCHAAPGINFDEDIAPFMNAVKKLRSRTGVHVMTLHHINKLEWDKHASLRSNVLRSIKGSSRLTSDPDTVQGIIERHGQLLLDF